MTYTVVGVNVLPGERVLLRIEADNLQEAERYAYAREPKMLIAAVFDGVVRPLGCRVGIQPDPLEQTCVNNMQQTACA